MTQSPPIQLHRLEGFYWVVKAGGYSKAARAFPYPITQPAVHQQVKKLERELGMTLLERVAKDRMLPTPAGRHLFDFVAPFFEELPQVVRILRAAEYGGVFRIHAQGIMLRHLLPSWLKRLKRKRPEIQVHLSEMMRFDVAPLLSGETDMIVGYLPQVPDEIASVEVGLIHPFLVLPREHRLARRQRVRLADLAGDSFLSYPPEHLVYGLQMEVLAEHGVEPQRIVSSSSADTILGFVEAGLGYSLVPSLDPRGPRIKGVVARPLKLPRLEYPVLAAWRKDTPENVLLDAVLATAPAL